MLSTCIIKKNLSSYSSKISWTPEVRGKTPQYLNKSIWFFIHNYIDISFTFAILLLLHNYEVFKKLQQIKNVKSEKLCLQNAKSQRQNMVTLMICRLCSYAGTVAPLRAQKCGVLPPTRRPFQNSMNLCRRCK